MKLNNYEDTIFKFNPLKKKLLKLDEKTIMIIKNNNIYLINIPKMKINQKYIFNNNSKIDFIYKIKKKYLYIYK